MARIILFEGKVTLGDRLVDFRIYKDNEDVLPYSFDVDPEVRDESQTGFHRGETQRADDLERLFSRFKLFKSEFIKIVEERKNENF